MNKAFRCICLTVFAVLAICIALSVPADCFAASDGNDQTGESMTVTNEAGQELVVTVEGYDDGSEGEKLTLNGMMDLDESDVPLAAKTFTPEGQQVHMVWMLILLAAVILYVIYFGYKQRKLFSLRREVIQAECEIRSKGR